MLLLCCFIGHSIWVPCRGSWIPIGPTRSRGQRKRKPLSRHFQVFPPTWHPCNKKHSTRSSRPSNVGYFWVEGEGQKFEISQCKHADGIIYLAPMMELLPALSARGRASRNANEISSVEAAGSDCRLKYFVCSS